jgi:RNA polymerase-binding protein DksA
VTKKARSKTKKSKSAGRKPAAARKKKAVKRTATKKTARKKSASRRTAAKKATAKKPARKPAATAARKRAKTRATAKKPKTARKEAAGRSARRASGKPVSAPPVSHDDARQPSTGAASGAPVRRASRLAPRELAYFRELLLAKRGELIGDVTTLQDQALSQNRQDAAGDLSSMPIHMADLGTDNYEKEFTLGLIEGERALLRDIDEALERIKNRTYGICQATGKPIGKARLKARPWAKFCYEYVLAQEKGQQTEGL